MTIKMYAPFVLAGSQFIASNGTPISVAANGMVNVADEDVLSFIRQGFQLAIGQGGGMPEARRTTHANNANSTLAGNALAYGKRVFLVVSGGAALTHTTATAANTLAAIPNVKLYDNWIARIINLNSGNLTVGPGSGVTLRASNGAAANTVLGTNTYADLYCQYDAANSVAMTVVGSGNAL